MVRENVLLENRVKKCIEFPLKDTASFFQRYVHGYYWLYDRKGQNIEQNSYDLLEDSLIEMVVNNIFDQDGRKIGSLWYRNGDRTLLERVSFHQYDTLGRKLEITDCSLNQDRYYCLRLDEYQGGNPPNILLDSSISSKQRIYYSMVQKEDGIDTISVEKQFYSQNHLDSVWSVHRTLYRSFYRKEVYLYNEEHVLWQQIIQSGKEPNKWDKKTTTYFSSNGLPQTREYIYPKGLEVKQLFTRFSYVHFLE